MTPLQVPQDQERKIGVSVRIANQSKRFREAKRKILINSFNLAKEEEQKRLSDVLSLHCEGDVLSSIPQCDCGACTGAAMENLVCQVCNTPVKPLTERSLEPVAWMAPPEGVVAFINPQVWTILSKAMSISGVNLLEYYTNPLTSMPVTPSRVLRKVIELKIPQGMNYFHDNFDQIIDQLFEVGALYHAGTRKVRADLRRFIQENRHLIFTEALPIPSKMAFVTAKTVTRTYADKIITAAMDAVNTITATENSAKPLSLRTRQARAAKANMLMAQYHQDNIGTNLARKPGQIRKHVVGTRLHFTFRAVISSIPGPHRYDELWLPWALAVKAFDIHLTNKLWARGFSDSQAVTYLAEHTHQYSELLDELFTEIIDEAPGPGYPCLLNRNPTLMRGSIQRMWITRIEKNPLINAIRMSVLSLRAPNADFDGRALPSLN